MAESKRKKIRTMSRKSKNTEINLLLIIYNIQNKAYSARP